VPSVYVARSLALQKWGAEVGVTKHLYKLGVFDGKPDEAIAALNAESCASQADWKLVKAEGAEGVDEASVLAKLSAKLREVDPGLYPKLRGARGIYKIRPEFVANHAMVQRAFAGGSHETIEKVKPADFAAYLIHHALE